MNTSARIESDHQERQVFPTFDRGIDFVGYRIFWIFTVKKDHMQADEGQDGENQKEGGKRSRNELFRMVFNQFIQGLVDAL